MVFEWFYHSENFTASPIVFLSRWDRGCWQAGSVRDIVMIAGWYREEITDVIDGQRIDYRVSRSIPAARQDFTRIDFLSEGSGTRITWTIELDVPVPAFLPDAAGSALANAGARMAGVLYGSIMRSAALALDK